MNLKSAEGIKTFQETTRGSGEGNGQEVLSAFGRAAFPSFLGGDMKRKGKYILKMHNGWKALAYAVLGYRYKISGNGFSVTLKRGK